MNGARTTFMRRGYLLTALAAAVLLAASVGTAEAQRVSIGYVGASGTVSESAFLDVNSLAEPRRITVRVQGLLGGTRRAGDVGRSLGEVTITPNASVRIATVSSSGAFTNAATASSAAPYFLTDTGATGGNSLFAVSDEVVLVVAQSDAAGSSDNGARDDNWVNEMVELRLEAVVPAATVGRTPASASPDTYTLTVEDSDLAPVAAFDESDFTLAEDSERMVTLNINAGRRGARIPPAATDAAGAFSAATKTVSVRVSNHNMIVVGAGAAAACPTGATAGTRAFAIDLEGDTAGTAQWAATNFANTGVLTTVSPINTLADAANDAVMTVTACGDTTSFRDPMLTLTIMASSLGDGAGGRAVGNISAGSPLTITAENNEMVPTLSFSPTDVTIDEGGSTETVLLAEGDHADQVGMVKLMVEGDAMVDLYHGDEMLQEMGGYVTVDMGMNNSARLMAMSTSDPDLMDGDTAYKAWKLMEGSTDAMIGDGYWFRVDVRGSTAVPALPLVGQLLLALFLMAGGSRLYRRRQG